MVRLSSDAVPLPGGVLGRESTGHSSYLAVGSTAAWNIAAVVAGRPGSRPWPAAAAQAVRARRATGPCARRRTRCARSPGRSPGCGP